MRCQSFIVLSALAVCAGAADTRTATLTKTATATLTKTATLMKETATATLTKETETAMLTKETATATLNETLNATATATVRVQQQRASPTLTLVPLSGFVTVCNVNATCRAFGDNEATCVNNKCQCSGTDTSDFCVGRKPLSTTRTVSVVVNYDYPCDAYFGSPDLQTKIPGALSRSVERFEGPKDTAVLCGSVNAVATADVQASQISQFTNSVVDEQDQATAGTAMENKRQSVTVQFNGNSECGEPVPPQLVLFKGATGCFPSACVEGYEPRSVKEQDYKTECVAISDDDDELSGAAIAGIVILCLACLIILVVVVVYLSSNKGMGSGIKDDEAPTGTEPAV